MSQARHYDMKDSGVEWIGEMPKDWNIVRFKRMHRGSNVGLSLDKDYWSTNEDDTVFYTAGLKSIHTSYKDIEPEMLTKENDLLLARNGTPYVYFPSIGAIYTDHIIRVGIENGYNKAFVRYCLQQSIANEVVDTVSIATWSVPIWNRQCLPHPSLAEQTAIAAYLDEKCAAIDAIIAEAKATIEEYKAWKASVIFEAVTKGLNPNAAMKDSGVEWIGEIPKDWGVERLKTMFSFGKGLPITKEDLVEQGIPVISYGQIHAKFNTGVEVLPELLRYVDAKWLKSNANSLVYEGDFIFADTSEDMEGCGNCVYVDTLGEGAQLFAGYHTITFKPKCSRNNKFLAYLFKSDAWRTQLRSRVGGVKLFSISRRMLNLATVILPPTTEQEAIVAYLDKKCAAIDGIIAEKEALISDLETYKKSLIFEVVTGKRRVC